MSAIAASLLPAPDWSPAQQACPALGEQFHWTLLIRHGQRPLGFMGRVLFEVALRDPDLPVWSEVAIYEADRQRLVAAIHHRLQGAPPLSRHYAEGCDDIDTALAFLHGHDPLFDLPVEALYGAAGETLEGLALLEAAGASAVRLRHAWRQILDTCFGTRNPRGEFQ